MINRYSLSAMVNNAESSPPQFQSKITRLGIFPLVGVHLLLGVIIYLAPELSTIHVYLVLLIGILWAISRPSVFAAYAVAYVVGAEVLWRMTDARFFWEGGKYASILILGLSIFQHRRKAIPTLPLLYFIFLLPSVTLTISSLDFSGTRDAVSFNLSGPFLLFVSSWYFSKIHFSAQEFKNLLISLILPITTTAIYALVTTFSNPNIVWLDDSMSQTSGGFGPNQVSTIMGLGVVAVWLILVVCKLTSRERILVSVIGIVLSFQAFLTFSRGGVLVATITVVFITAHAIREKSYKYKLLIYMLVVGVFMFTFLIPALNDFSQGAFETRFSDSNLTHRDVLLQEELQLFRDNPIGGVGPGVGNEARHVGNVTSAASHTEFTRMLGEHGVLGAMSLALLVLMTLQRYFSSKNNLSRGTRGSFMLWSLLVMTNAAMRVASISFLFGLGFAEIDLDDTN